MRKISEMTIIPGDTILLKAGSVFNGEDAHLTFKGSGTAQAPIRIASYGEGARPCLNGQGEVTDVISLYNQEYIIIEDLEITNLHPKYSSDFKLNSSNNRQVPLRAVHVIAKDYGVVHSVHLKNLYIHDINGNLAMKWNGGIFFDIEADVVEGKLTESLKYDDVLIEGCKFERSSFSYKIGKFSMG